MLRGLTLAEIGKRVGTTAQTIQRLETGRLTMSLDWLTRIAAALELQPTDLLPPRVRFVGDLRRDGTIVPPMAGDPPPLIAIEVPGSDPMAVKLAERMGPYEIGTILVADRLERDDQSRADGKDCLVQTESGQLLFRRLVLDELGIAAYIPYEASQRIDRRLAVRWIAPVLMAVRYID